MANNKKGVFLNFFQPSIYVRTFNDVNITQLKRQGIKLFISDLDNTLVPHYNKLPNKNVMKFINKVREAGIEFVLMSNNIRSRVEPFAKRAEIEEWHSNARKPFKFVIKKILDKRKIHPSEVVIMGDQLIFDILVANRMKCESILVQPLISSGYEMSKFNLFLERTIYKHLERNNILRNNDLVKTSTIDKDMLL